MFGIIMGCVVCVLYVGFQGMFITTWIADELYKG